jgi:tetratricopeptide (TPR) repeat protein
MFAGAALLVLIVVLAWPAIRGADREPADGRMPIDQMDGAGNDVATTGAPPPLTGTPREQADRLFNRVMTEQAGGDTAQARFFVPMALQAYDMAGDLDPDGHYHVSLLHGVAGDHKAALASAEQVLATSPNHLLGLAAAANAARASGDNASARRYYQRFLNAFDAESKTSRQEYVDHGKILPDLKTEAEKFVKR